MRADHAARAIENGVCFVRGNNVVLDPKKSGITHNAGVGCGGSYIMDPGGEMIVRSQRHMGDFIFADVDTSRKPDQAFGMSKNAWSLREFGALLAEAARGNGMRSAEWPRSAHTVRQ